VSEREVEVARGLSCAEQRTFKPSSVTCDRPIERPNPEVPALA
jgi:hypothetical protein